MGLVGFSIKLDNVCNTYYAGQTVSGNIIIVLNSTKKIRGIRIKLKGEANTSLENRQSVSETRETATGNTSTVTSHETYFNAKYYILGSAKGNQIDLSAGRHSYPFAFALPKELPSSFEHKYGHIRYTVEAAFQQPWKPDKKTKIAFTVLSDFDLNSEPRASESLRQVMSKTSGSLWCGSAPLEIVATMPVKGFVPGQTMLIRINVDNFSGLEVQTIKVILHKIITFYAKKPDKLKLSVSYVMAEASNGPIMTGEDTYYNQELKIPDTPQPNLANCGIIDIIYNLEIKARTPGWHRNLKSNNLVFIGTIPLRNNIPTNILVPKNTIDQSRLLNDSSTSSNNYQSAVPTAPPPPAYDSIAPVNLYPVLPPPSYGDVIWSSENS